MTNAPKMTTEQVGERELVMRRVFNAPRELVWKAYTERDAIEQWWGPRGFTTEVREMDVRPGGVWHYYMGSPEFGGSWAKVTYREVVAPERLVYLDAFADEQGNLNEEMPQMLITLTFEDQDGRTLLTARTEFASPEERAKVIEMGAEQGMAETLDRLEEYLGTGSRST